MFAYKKTLRLEALYYQLMQEQREEHPRAGASES